MNNKITRTLVGFVSVTVLVLFFLFFQDTDFASMFVSSDHVAGKFIFNRSLRFILNDFFAVLLIFAIFAEKKYVVFAIWVQVFGLVFLLVPYFILKLYHPSYNGPLLNFLHRIILNPTLLLLLIPAFYYQIRSKNSDQEV